MKIACIIKRPDIWHLYGLVNSVNCEHEWLFIKDKFTDYNILETTLDIFKIIDMNINVVSIKECIEIIKSSNYDYVIRQDQWEGWGKLNSLHNICNTLFVDYVSIPDAMDKKSHGKYALSNNYYIDNCTYGFINDKNHLLSDRKNIYESVSYKALGIKMCPSKWVCDTNKIKVLIELHFPSSDNSILGCSIIDTQYDEILEFCKIHNEYSICINLHPQIYLRYKEIVENIENDTKKLDHVTVSSMSMHILAKSSDFIISDGISMLYESNIINKPCVRIKDPKYKKLFSNKYYFLVENMPTVSNILDIHDIENYVINPDNELIKDYLLKGRNTAGEIL